MVRLRSSRMSNTRETYFQRIQARRWIRATRCSSFSIGWTARVLARSGAAMRSWASERIRRACCLSSGSSDRSRAYAAVERSRVFPEELQTCEKRLA